MLSTKVVTVSRSFPRNSYAISRVFRSTQRVPEATLKIFEKKRTFSYVPRDLSGIIRRVPEQVFKLAAKTWKCVRN